MNKQILLVDDEPDLVKLVKMRLEVTGYSVSVATDGQEVFQKAQIEKPNLVILDIMLPKMNGYEVCRLLKSNEIYKEIPIIIFTAKAQEKDEKLAKECGADAYLRKPFNAQELLEQIQSLLISASNLPS